MWIDTKQLNEDLCPEDVANLAGIPIKKKGKQTFILCPNHNDHHFGNAYLTKNGFKCHACNVYMNSISMYMTATGEPFLQAIKNLGNLVGGLKPYQLSNQQVEEKEAIRSKLPSLDERDLLGLNPTKNFDKEYYPINAFPISPNERNMKHVVSEEEEFLILDENKRQNLNILYQEDFPAYCYLIVTKGLEKIDIINSLLPLFSGKDSFSVNMTYILQKKKKQIYKILEKTICLKADV